MGANARRYSCTQNEKLVVEHLPSKQYVVDSNSAWAALFSFSVKKELFRLVVLPCLFM